MVTRVKDGQPLAGAQVSLLGQVVTADTSGKYTFASVPQGSYSITASATGYLKQQANISVAGTPVAQNFTLATAGVLKGRVVTAAGAGISGAHVDYSGSVLNTFGQITTDSNGYFNAGWVPAASYTVTVSASPSSFKTQYTAVNTGATTTLTFVF